ncbi:MAG: bifunctional 5,10-methylenetetrahydrofolate dehydrogenase/5,10-methenyltetrahydrofolate cyclohydrolase [bacterium]
MDTILIDGNKIRDEIAVLLRNKAKSLPLKLVCFVTFGGNIATRQFVARKMAFAQEIGVQAVSRELRAENTKDALTQLQTLIDENYDGIVIQLPIDNRLETDTLLDAVPIELDIDILSAKAKLALREGKTKRLPPVAGAVRKIFEKYDITPEGKKMVILGKGRLVGEPVSELFSGLGIPYNIFDINSDIIDRNRALSEADIVISGVGKPNLVVPEMLKQGVVLIDAGTSEQAGKLVGDIDPGCTGKASLLTPVPGGIGPITVATLFSNLFSN